jgi:glutamyl/glutaminyl-tRNA synthetase
MNLNKNVFNNLFAGLDLYIKSWKKYIVSKNLEFIPHPQTWLNQERWNDEVLFSAESISLINLDRSKVENEAQKKKQALEKAEFEEAKAKIDKKIQELKENDPARLERIREKISEEVKIKTPNLKPDLFNKTIDIHLRAKIKEIYFSNNK